MGMRRAQAEIRSEAPAVKPLKRVAAFDDSSIRKMLRSAYNDFVGEELELRMNHDAGSPAMAGLKNSDDKSWANLSHLQNRAELKLFWDMFVQKQIFVFEQESALLLEVAKEENW
ncbi:MAG: hypothetical protein L0387_03395 [Acidobacteria bacterium]|nr:hypothetical protein [Acidobacteriota bacterium]MCI0620707.1 hypothetical protein [Acidobacteriota bacterium]MCI0719249.1 hypothetical protein [Acidobacteriota bacterium]